MLFMHRLIFLHDNVYIIFIFTMYAIAIFNRVFTLSLVACLWRCIKVDDIFISSEYYFHALKMTKKEFKPSAKELLNL